jgi:hypothetical protein
MLFQGSSCNLICYSHKGFEFLCVNPKARSHRLSRGFVLVFELHRFTRVINKFQFIFIYNGFITAKNSLIYLKSTIFHLCPTK